MVISQFEGQGQMTTIRFNDKSTFHEAARNGDLDLLKESLQTGLNIDESDVDGLTLLLASIVENQTEAAVFLVKKGANVNKPDFKGNFPLHHATRRGNARIIRYLIRAGAKKDGLNGVYDSALHIAASLGQTATIKLLLNLGCNVNISKPDGATPLHSLVSCTSQTTFQQNLELLLLAGCDINKQAYSTLESPLYKAITMEMEHFAELLLSYGADPNISSPFDITVLQTCKVNEYSRLVNMILHCGIQWKRERWLAPLTGPVSSEQSSLLNVIHKWRTKPVKLINLCRISLRNHYKERLFRVVSQLLPVPNSVKDFLFLRDLHWSEIASGTAKMQLGDFESEELSDVAEFRKNEDEDVCD